MNIAQADVKLLPVTAILTPLVKVQAKARYLQCDKCDGITRQTLVHDRYGWWYVCNCGEKTQYLVVTESGKL